MVEKLLYDLLFVHRHILSYSNVALLYHNEERSGMPNRQAKLLLPDKAISHLSQQRKSPAIADQGY
jgi:hypothetical protein